MGGSKLSCSYCGKQFAKMAARKQHEQEVHIQVFKCPACSQGFASERILGSHQNVCKAKTEAESDHAHISVTANPVEAFECSYCDQLFRSSEDMLKHEEDHNSQVESDQEEETPMPAKVGTSVVAPQPGPVAQAVTVKIEQPVSGDTPSSSIPAAREKAVWLPDMQQKHRQLVLRATALRRVVERKEEQTRKQSAMDVVKEKMKPEPRRSTTVAAKPSPETQLSVRKAKSLDKMLVRHKDLSEKLAKLKRKVNEDQKRKALAEDTRRSSKTSHNVAKNLPVVPFTPELERSDELSMQLLLEPEVEIKEEPQELLLAPETASETVAQPAEIAHSPQELADKLETYKALKTKLLQNSLNVTEVSRNLSETPSKVNVIEAKLQNNSILTSTKVPEKLIKSPRKITVAEAKQMQKQLIVQQRTKIPENVSETPTKVSVAAAKKEKKIIEQKLFAEKRLKQKLHREELIKDVQRRMAEKRRVKDEEEVTKQERSLKESLIELRQAVDEAAMQAESFNPKSRKKSRRQMRKHLQEKTEKRLEPVMSMEAKLEKISEMKAEKETLLSKLAEYKGINEINAEYLADLVPPIEITPMREDEEKEICPPNKIEEFPESRLENQDEDTNENNVYRESPNYFRDKEEDISLSLLPQPLQHHSSASKDCDQSSGFVSSQKRLFMEVCVSDDESDDDQDEEELMHYISFSVPKKKKETKENKNMEISFNENDFIEDEEIVNDVQFITDNELNNYEEKNNNAKEKTLDGPAHEETVVVPVVFDKECIEDTGKVKPENIAVSAPVKVNETGRRALFSGVILDDNIAEEVVKEILSDLLVEFMRTCDEEQSLTRKKAETHETYYWTWEAEVLNQTWSEASKFEIIFSKDENAEEVLEVFRAGKLTKGLLEKQLAELGWSGTAEFLPEGWWMRIDPGLLVDDTESSIYGSLTYTFITEKFQILLSSAAALQFLVDQEYPAEIVALFGQNCNVEMEEVEEDGFEEDDEAFMEYLGEEEGGEGEEEEDDEAFMEYIS